MRAVDHTRHCAVAPCFRLSRGGRFRPGCHTVHDRQDTHWERNRLLWSGTHLSFHKGAAFWVRVVAAPKPRGRSRRVDHRSRGSGPHASTVPDVGALATAGVVRDRSLHRWAWIHFFVSGANLIPKCPVASSVPSLLIAETTRNARWQIARFNVRVRKVIRRQ